MVRGKTSVSELERKVSGALRKSKADLVIKAVGYLNVPLGKFVKSDIAICGANIVGVGEGYRGEVEIDGTGLYAVPGFIDAHVHVESSLLVPENFDKTVLKHGTTTLFCDPHEIANVLGTKGIEYFLDSAQKCRADLFVMLPSCVPASHLETSGYSLDADDLLAYKHHERVLGLAEMMNFSAVINCDKAVLGKISAFSDYHIDGHSPLLGGDNLNAYLSCGIRTCHESTSFDEAYEKLKRGMYVLMREGSVSKDVVRLAPLLDHHNWPFIAFCSDDRNPLDIADEGHIDCAMRKAIAAGADAIDVYRSVSWAAANMFGLRDRGVIAPGFVADIVLLNELENVDVKLTIKNGKLVDDRLFEGVEYPEIIGLDSVKLREVDAQDFTIHSNEISTSVIGVIEGSLLTEYYNLDLPVKDGVKYPSKELNVQKISVLERHGKNGNISLGFVKGFRLTRGALASSVSHDSHNICVVGLNDNDMAQAVNRLRELGGGFVVVSDGNIRAELSLAVAGLMSDRSAEEIVLKLKALKKQVKMLGCELDEPFLQLAFLALPVIPNLKITDMGLVDVNRFSLLKT